MRAILLDLDDTLLGNSMEVFLPAYFRALSTWMADRVEPERLIAELLRATRVMAANDGTGPTNAEVFAAEFYPALGASRDELEPELERFYREAFPALEPLTSRRPEARELVEMAFARGLDVVIATNPLFPAIAIEHRLAWAGVPVTEFPYAMVTTYETMHASKARPEYYREILGRIGRAPADCLMAGDDWGWDIVQAASVDVPAFWIAPPQAPTPNPAPPLLVGRGTLAELRDLIEMSTAAEG